jgi:predicted dehydrogenase
MDLLRMPEVQVVAVCDVNRQSSDYLDWGPNELRNKVRLLLQQPGWGKSLSGPAAGRDVAQSIVNTFYASGTGKSSYNGCASYEDFRELLSKEKDLDAVIVSTPDHWHALIAIAAMRAGKHVYSQKPMAHSVWEAHQMAKVAKETGRATAVSIFNAQTAESRRVIDIVQSGAIGPVNRVDIWTTRASAFWKQGLRTPVSADPIPAGLNWDMWLGPAPFRRTTMLISRLSGGPGTTTVVAPLVTWVNTGSTPSYVHSSWALRNRYMPARLSSFLIATRWRPRCIIAFPKGPASLL